MWPEIPSKYNLILRVVKRPENPWKALTYWQTDLKNLHFVYQLLRYAKDPSYLVGKNWYIRARSKFISYGLLNKAGRPSKSGLRFLKDVEAKITNNPDYFKDDVRPFELEYLFHKQLYEAGYLNVYDNLQELFSIVPDLNVDDLESVVSIVSLNNSPETLRSFQALTKEEKTQLFEQVRDIHKEFKEAGGKLEVKNIAHSDWLPLIDLISIGRLGNQNDGYYRAASLLKAHILLLSLITLKEVGPHTFEDLYEPFKANIDREAFLRLLAAESEIEEIGTGYKYSPERKISGFDYVEDETTEEIRKIKYETFTLSPEERMNKIKVQLRAAERAPIVTVSASEGRQRIVKVRHTRDAKVSAALRLYLGDICQHCGFDGNNQYGTGIAEVDHAIDEISVTQNNRPSNLIVLCPNCHAAKTKGILKITDGGTYFNIANTFTGQTTRINKVDLS